MDEKIVKDSQGLAKELVNDCISRKAALDALEKSKEIYFDRQVIIGAMKDIVRNLPSAQPKSYREGYQAGFKDAQLEQRWIPCSERLPEEDTEVLISYRYKEGEGDTDHVNIDITSYGTTCFGGREIHTLKEWRQPFDYFHANYEVIAWMPLPEPYREDDK